jgi:hypothetical protein
MTDSGTSTGRACDGYEPIEQKPGRSSKSRGNLALIRVGTTCGSEEETRYLQFFFEKTLMQFQTFFPDDLWSRCLPQIAESESCIRHALVALSSYHRRYIDRQVQDGGASFALGQYNLAIKGLVRSPQGPPQPPHIYLVSCLIFICIEVSVGCAYVA